MSAHQPPITSHQSPDFIQLCSWCLALNPPKLRFLSQVQLRDGEGFEIRDEEAGPMRFLKGFPGKMREMKVSHGICQEHAVQLKSEGGMRQ